MKRPGLPTVVLLCVSLFQHSCATLGDDQFAHHVKRGHTQAALKIIQPHSGKLRITERNGRTYYPIEYSLVNGDRAVTYALLENGSPRSLYGRSLAYNAAVIGDRGFAIDLANRGYGTSSDVRTGWHQYQTNLRAKQRNAELSAAAGLFVLALFLGALGSGGGGGGHHSTCETCGSYSPSLTNGNCASCMGAILHASGTPGF